MQIKPFSPSLNKGSSVAGPTTVKTAKIDSGEKKEQRETVSLSGRAFTTAASKPQAPAAFKPAPKAKANPSSNGVPVTLLAVESTLPEVTTADPLATDFTALLKETSKPAEKSEGSKLRKIASDANVQETLPHQNRSRAPWTYAFMLGPAFRETIAEKSASSEPWNWMDAGSGVTNVASAIMARGAAGLVQPRYTSGEYIYKQGEPAESLSVTLVDLDTPVKPTDRTTVFTGRKIEDIPSSELGQHDLLTEIQGPLAYSNRPDLVLKSYMGALKDDGKLFVSLGSNQDRARVPFGETNKIVGKDGVARNYVEWMTSIPGLQVKVHEIIKPSEVTEIRALSLEIQKKPNEAVLIPELEEAPVFLEEGGPPRMVIREKSDIVGAETKSVQEARNATRAAMQNVTSSETGADLLDKFKGGVLSSALKRVEDGEWAHLSKVSPQVEASITSPNEQERLELGGLFGSRAPLGTVVDNPSNLKPDRSLKLISDDGPLSWSYRPDQTLKSYLNALSDDGEILINLGDEANGQGLRTTVFSQGGDEFSLAKWLKRSNGLDVEIHEKWGDRPEEDTRVAQIRIKDREKIEIPELQLLAVNPPAADGTHSALLQEKVDFEPKISMLRRVGKELAVFWHNYLS